VIETTSDQVKISSLSLNDQAMGEFSLKWATKWATKIKIHQMRLLPVCGQDLWPILRGS